MHIPMTLVEQCSHYIITLSESAERTNFADDRPTYCAHLAAAAVILAKMEMGAPWEEVQELVASERRACGWGYLSGDAGAKAEQEFSEFAAAVNAR